MRATRSIFSMLILVACAAMVGCKASAEVGDDDTAKSAEVAAAPAAPPAPPLPTIRINAGAAAPYTDPQGNVWAIDSGFTGGEVIDRGPIAIGNTDKPDIYRTERYSMTAFSQAVPNGRYAVKLHFAETYDGVLGAGQRVFSYNVEGKDFKDFDVWVKAGGALKAYIEVVEVEVADEKLDITFTFGIENPEINAIEIMPAQ